MFVRTGGVTANWPGRGQAAASASVRLTHLRPVSITSPTDQELQSIKTTKYIAYIRVG